MRDGGRERMLTAFKTPMGILCHCILSPLLLASTISQHGVCVSLSPSLSERISHPLLLQLLAASLLTFTNHPFFSLSLHSTFFLFSFYYHTPVLLSLTGFFGLFLCVELPTASKPCHLTPPSCLATSSLLPTPLLLTGRRRRRRGGWEGS